MPAPFGRRLAAIFYDSLILLGLLFVAEALLLAARGGATVPVGNWLHTAYLLAVPGMFFCWFWIHGGQTAGMRAWKIRVVSDSGAPLTWSSALLRLIASMLSWLPFGAGFLYALFNGEHRCFHDIASRTRLIRTDIQSE